LAGRGKLNLMPATTTLYRPTGADELALIRAADFRAFMRTVL
jgi:hypothetical protein